LSEYAPGVGRQRDASLLPLHSVLDLAEQYLGSMGKDGWIERIEIDKHGGLNLLLAAGDDRDWLDFAGDPPRISGPLNDPSIMLSGIVGRDGPDSGYEVLNYRPSRRLVVSGRQNSVDVVLKGYRKGKCARQAGKARLATKILAGSDIRTAPVLEVNLRNDFLVMQRMGGRRPVIRAQQADDFLVTGAGIRRLQTATKEIVHGMDALEGFNRRDELAVVDERLRRLQLVGGGLPPDWQELRRRLEKTAASIPQAELVAAHRDLHDGQWLLGRGRPCLLDFDLLCTAEPELDPANFLAHLSLRHLQHRAQISARDVDACGEAFLQGLALPATRESRRRLHFYLASTFARLALVYVLRPRWQGVVPELVRRGHRCLDDLLSVGC